MATTRNAAYDLVRVAACTMVVLMHSPIPGAAAGNSGVFLSALSFLTAPCIGLFFMVSGALLIDSCKDGGGTFLRRRFAKIAIPTLIWSCIYLILSYLTNQGYSQLPRSVISMMFSAQGYGTMWFMYTLAGLYLITPILSSWLRVASRRAVEFYLCLWAVAMMYPYIGNWLDINTSETGILYYMSGYVGYYVLGWYMKHYGQTWRMITPLVLSAIAIAAKAIDKVYGFGIDQAGGFWYLSAAVAVMCILWWLIAQKIASKTETGGRVLSVVTLISNYSFGIYLCHIAVMRFGLWRCDWFSSIMPYPLQTLIVASLTMLISVVFCRVVAALPFSQYIIGYKK